MNGDCGPAAQFDNENITVAFESKKWEPKQFFVG